MPVQHGNATYLTATEFAKRIGIAPELFHKNVKSQVQRYTIPGYRRPYYLAKDTERFLDAKKEGTEAPSPEID